MIRRFNYTGRRRITQEQVLISLIEDGEQFLKFNAELNISNLNLPPEACIYIEAYRQDAYMRFAWGTVQSPSTSSTRVLSEIDPSGRVYFRVKVVDESAGRGLILAQADQITVDIESESPMGLLPVKVAEGLGELIWQVEFEPEEPYLYLNYNISAIKEHAQSDRRFAALVYPQILRSVLNHIVSQELQADDYPWVDDWLKFSESLSEEPRPEDDSQMVEWVESVVTAFASKHRFRQVYQEVLGASSQTQ